ncbi:PREDICTED: sporamin B-like [Ipomoea nil]|uniref:sporamin B-like n=1 Tax=Ipomoea nil TaxID=35883 RepID=UPI0009011B57|nr:PREDICTED: sporamin B-like [Ipomoea nil]
MKTLAILLFAFSLYLLPNPTHSAFNPIRLPIRLPTADAAVASDNTPVVDTDGNELRAGETYYITSIETPHSASAGVQLAWLNSTAQCASNVVVSRCFSFGDPIRVRPTDPNAAVVLPSKFLSFEFSVSTPRVCASSVYWGIQYDRPSQQFFLNSGEFVSDLSGQFKIEARGDPNNYRIDYCPFGGHKCYHVDLNFDESARAVRWVLSENSFLPVLFRKTRNCLDFTL